MGTVRIIHMSLVYFPTLSSSYSYLFPALVGGLLAQEYLCLFTITYFATYRMRCCLLYPVRGVDNRSRAYGTYSTDAKVPAVDKKHSKHRVIIFEVILSTSISGSRPAYR